MNAIRHATNIWTLAIASCAAAIVTCAPRAATADFLPVYGGLTHSPNGGYLAEFPPPDFVGYPHVNDAGTAVATAIKNVPDGDGYQMVGRRALRWDSAGATELGHLGTWTNTNLNTDSVANAINLAGTAVGWAKKFDGSGNDSGARTAVRWDASATAATELGRIAAAGAESLSNSINDAGTAVGWAAKPYNYVSGYWPGRRAVRWAASGAATELGHLGTDAKGYTLSEATSINSVGTAVGWASKFDNGNYVGDRPVRWDASGTALELTYPFLGGFSVSNVTINDAGTVVGNVYGRAVRWDAAGTATVLPILPPPNVPHTVLLKKSYASAINALGSAAGRIEYFTSEILCDESGCYDIGSTYGTRAVRWDASGTTVTGLEQLGTDANGFSFDDAHAINSAGTVVGSARKYDASGNPIGGRAVYWNADGAVIDLNTLIDPAGGWILWQAYDISDTGWIAGIGLFSDPDGPSGGPRHFLIHVPATAAILPGDFNRDGTVNAADYVVWRKTGGSQHDYNRWRANFGQTTGSGAALPSAKPLSVAVPEPATLVLLIVAVCIGINRCRTEAVSSKLISA